MRDETAAAGTQPTSAMEPWLQKAVHDKVLIEKSTRVRSSDPEVVVYVD